MTVDSGFYLKLPLVEYVRSVAHYCCFEKNTRTFVLDAFQSSVCLSIHSFAKHFHAYPSNTSRARAFQIETTTTNLMIIHVFFIHSFVRSSFILSSFIDYFFIHSFISMTCHSSTLAKSCSPWGWSHSMTRPQFDSEADLHGARSHEQLTAHNWVRVSLRTGISLSTVYVWHLTVLMCWLECNRSCLCVRRRFLYHVSFLQLPSAFDRLMTPFVKLSMWAAYSNNIHFYVHVSFCCL